MQSAVWFDLQWVLILCMALTAAVSSAQWGEFFFNLFLFLLTCQINSNHFRHFSQLFHHAHVCFT